MRKTLASAIAAVLALTMATSCSQSSKNGNGQDTTDTATQNIEEQIDAAQTVAEEAEILNPDQVKIGVIERQYTTSRNKDKPPDNSRLQRNLVRPLPPIQACLRCRSRKIRRQSRIYICGCRQQPQHSSRIRSGRHPACHIHHPGERIQDICRHTGPPAPGIVLQANRRKHVT